MQLKNPDWLWPERMAEMDNNLARQMAARAEGPGEVEERARIAVELSRLPRDRQGLSLSQAQERDRLVEYLLAEGEYGALLTLLGSDLGRWLPGAVEFSRLQWLLETLLNVKEKAAGKKARVFVGDGAAEPRASAALLVAILDEAIEAAAGAWVRCLGGPGGEHRVWELPRVLEDADLAEAILGELAARPRELAMLLEDVPPQLAATALTPAQLQEYLQRGAGAARFCYDTILQGQQKLLGK